MNALIEGMSGPELLGFVVFVVMTVTFFVWAAYLAVSE